MSRRLFLFLLCFFAHGTFAQSPKPKFDWQHVVSIAVTLNEQNPCQQPVFSIAKASDIAEIVKAFNQKPDMSQYGCGAPGYRIWFRDRQGFVVTGNIGITQMSVRGKPGLYVLSKRAIELVQAKESCGE